MRLHDGAASVSRYLPILKGRICRTCKCLFIREWGWRVKSLYSSRYVMTLEDKINYYCKECGPQLGEHEHCISKRCKKCPLKLTCLGRPVQ
jgi:hypothetical protein